MREAKYTRHWCILQFILNHSRGLRVDEIAEEVECSTRTVRRDLEMLQRAGFPIQSEKTIRGRVWKLAHSFQNTPPIPFGPLDALALIVARNAMNDAANSLFRDQLDSILARLSQGRTPEFLQRLGKMEKSVYCQPMQHDGSLAGCPSRHCDDIISAIEKHRKLRTDYRNAAGHISRSRLLAPLRLWVVGRETYLVAFCYHQGGVCTFSLRRFIRIEMTKEEFTPEWNFDLESIAPQSYGVFHTKPEHIDLVFDRVLHTYLLDYPLHPSQQITKLKQGVRVRLHVGINESLIHELMGFGAQVRVSKPHSLAKLLTERHKAASSYSTLESANATPPRTSLTRVGKLS